MCALTKMCINNLITMSHKYSVTPIIMQYVILTSNL